MQPSEAAKLIGITHAQVCQAVRKGLLPAKKRKLNNGNPGAFTYEISERDAIYYRDHRPKRGPKPKPRSLV